jgi:hypothetical protein
MIKAKAYWEKATKSSYGMRGRPGGWVLCDTDTGKRLDSHRYPTEQEAIDAIPSVVAGVQTRRDAAAQQQAVDAAGTTSPRRYTEVHSAAFGTGRRYHSQPGATQYDDGSGNYGIQIWDNA